MLNLQKITQYLLYLLVFLLPWQTRWILWPGELNGGYFEYGTISLYLIDILLVLALVTFLWRQLSNKESDFFKKKPDFLFVGWILLGVFEFFVFLSCFFAFNFWLAIYAYIRFLLGIALFFLIINAPIKKECILTSFLAGAFLQVILGIWQFLTQYSFASKYLGMAEHRAWILGNSVIEAGGGRWLRAYGGLDHPNIFGGLMALSILFLIFWGWGKNKNKPWFYASLLIFWTALIFSFSRAAWLGVGAGLVFYFLANIFNKEKRAILLKVFLLIFILSASLGFIYSKLFISRIFLSQSDCSEIVIPTERSERRDPLKMGNTMNIKPSRLRDSSLALGMTIFGQSVAVPKTQTEGLPPLQGKTTTEKTLTQKNRLEIKSISERIALAQEAKEIIKKHFFFGVGVGNYGLAVYNDIDHSRPSYSYQPVHNVFLLIWAELGIFGLVSFLIFLFYIIYILAKNQYFDALAILFSVIIMMIFDHWWWSLHFGVLLFWLSLGILFRFLKVN